MEFGKYLKYKIIIESSDNQGFIVTVGRGRFIASNNSVLLDYLSDYLKNPEKAEKLFNDNCKQVEPVLDSDEDCGSSSHLNRQLTSS